MSYYYLINNGTSKVEEIRRKVIGKYLIEKGKGNFRYVTKEEYKGVPAGFRLLKMG